MQKKVWFHVDMDGLGAIYEGRKKHFSLPRDDFFLSAVDNCLEFFNDQKITATFFVIARDLDDPLKLRSIKKVSACGHHIGCHGYNHAMLYSLDSKKKENEIRIAKKKIEDALSASCRGFRAPGYSLDFESLQIIRDSGFLYDSSVFPAYAFKKRLGIERLFTEPFLLFENGLFEIPLPYIFPGLPPFHPCYSFYLGGAYFSFCLNRFKQQNNYLTLLLHLTDFASKQKIKQSFDLNFYSNNFFSKQTKIGFLNKIVKRTKENFTPTTTEDFLKNWPASAPDLNPKTILGISATHETGACIVIDGKIACAINEERLSRKKLDTVYPPRRSIRQVIKISGVDPRDIDAVAISGLSWIELLPQMLESLKQDVFDYHAFNDYFPHFCRLAYRIFYFWRALRYGSVLQFLEKTYGIRPKIYYIEHHEAHASSAYRSGANNKALIITADGVGDEICITFSQGTGPTIRRMEKFYYPNSFGNFYTACTQMLGFKGGRHEGKITGLSGYGKPILELIAAIEKTLFLKGEFKLNKHYYDEGFIRGFKIKEVLEGQFHFESLDYRNYKPPLKKIIKGYRREDVAYAFQYILQREMIRLARRHYDAKNPHIVLAGGVFANVLLNMALSQAFNPQDIFIFPHMGDGGLNVGAALNVLGKMPEGLQDVYLGTEFSEDEIIQSLKNNPTITYTRPGDMVGTAAKALADRKIVARFDGRMEYGPRALGNRSILYHCADPTVNSWLNQRLKRTEFMPFAPICLYEDAQDYFMIKEGEKHACEFMTLVVNCSEKMKKICPAAVHVDGTARPQLIRRETNPGMYDILAAYKKLTGISCLINTSFNMHEEPIVHSPNDAITAFLQGGLDLLILGPYISRRA